MVAHLVSTSRVAFAKHWTGQLPLDDQGHVVCAKEDLAHASGNVLAAHGVEVVDELYHRFAFCGARPTGMWRFNE
jgi:hypothetical protein